MITAWQEPKYEYREGAWHNRATGKAIPADEPVVLLRGTDELAVTALMAYREACVDVNHRDAVSLRLYQFYGYQALHKRRLQPFILIEQPDDMLIYADEPVMLFRAKDAHAVTLLSAYVRSMTRNEGDVYAAAVAKLDAFVSFSERAADRMKEPDTDMVA